MNKYTIAKSSLCILLILSTYASFSQSKKEQIETLNKRIDSLSSVIELERLINIDKTNEIITTTAKISRLTDKIDLLQNDVSKLNSDLQKSESELKLLKLELDIRQITINDLRTQLKLKTDSLNVIKVNSESHKNMSKKFADNSSEFQTFLSTFLMETFSGVKFDSLVYVASPIFTKYIETKSLGFGRFNNDGGMYCYLYTDNGFNYRFDEFHFGFKKPNISKLKFFQNKKTNGGFCEEATSPDGIYFEQVNELPKEWDTENGTEIPTPLKYKNLRKIKVQIQYEKWIIKTFYFIEFDTKWYLLYIDDCDCSV